MWWMWIVKLVGGLDINGLASTAAKAYASKVDAGVKRDDIEANLIARETELAVREATLNQQVILAEQGNWFTRSIRPLTALPFVAYLWKVVLWDNVIMADWVNGVTHPLSTAVAATMTTVIGAYFVGRTVERTINAVRSKEQ